MIQDYTITLAGRTVAFSMDVDPGGCLADRDMLTVLKRDGCCEPEVAHVMARALRPGDLAVDAGACTGFFTLLMSRLVGETGRVVAIEPAPDNWSRLYRNLQINGIESSSVEHWFFPLWSSIGQIQLYLSKHGGFCSLRPHEDAAADSIVLVSRTLDDIIGSRVSRLVKLDCEGAELEIVRGGLKTLARTAFVTCEMNAAALARFGATPDDVRQRFYSLLFDMFWLAPDCSRPVLVPNGQVVEYRRANTNVLFSTVEAVGEAWG